MIRNSWWVAAGLALAVVIPALATGEVVHLRDGSSLQGRLLAVAGDSLTFRLAIGPQVKIHRAQVLSIVFDESAGTAPPALGTPTLPPANSGVGTITVSFKDTKISSKISVHMKKDYEAHVRSNAIVVELIVDGNVVYSATDTTMDKTIYKGHETQLKNDATLEGFSVEVPAGRFQCEVIVRNFDENTFRDDFDPEPLHAALVLDEFEVRADGGVRIEVGIDRGTMKLGKAKLYRVE
jgi:hypothetical protein